MRGLSLKEIAEATKGSFIGETKDEGRMISRVSIDSRQCGEGTLFVPLKGENVDGHQYIDSAMEAGALVISEQQLNFKCCPYVRVESTYQAIKDLAAYYLEQIRENLKIIGIIGSVGKTSTREMVASVLSQQFKVLKTEGNFNNGLGVPLTIFRLTGEEDIAVIEMGISEFGEMRSLGSIVHPDIVIMTNIGSCHLETLQNREGVLQAKSEIFDCMRDDGVVILNGNDDMLSTIVDIKGNKPLFYRVKLDEEVYGVDRRETVAHSITDRGMEGVTATFLLSNNKHFDADIPLPGVHNVYNALAAATVGDVLGMFTDDMKRGIESIKAVSGRNNILETGKLTIIDDCYNANPMSMRASLDVLEKSEARKVAILGDMGELGAEERKEHSELGLYAAFRNIDLFLVVGKLMNEFKGGYLSGAAQGECIHYQSVVKLLSELGGRIRPGDTVLVKASHFMGFSKIVEALKDY